MATTTQTATVKTTVLYEAPLIGGLHESLKAAKKRMTAAALSAESNYEAQKYGEMVGHLEHAESALFELLNHSAHALDCDEAGEALDRILGRAKPAVTEPEPDLRAVAVAGARDTWGGYPDATVPPPDGEAPEGTWK